LRSGAISRCPTTEGRSDPSWLTDVEIKGLRTYRYTENDGRYKIPALYGPTIEVVHGPVDILIGAVLAHDG
jgi:hypothetical protein